jgi:hypothetical protein
MISSLPLLFSFVASVVGYTICQGFSSLGSLAIDGVYFFDAKSNAASVDARTGSLENLA